MSIALVRTALETKLNAISPALASAWENVPYTPVTGTPYQACFLMTATPDNNTLGCAHYKEQGLFQISLFYPLQIGAQVAEVRADLIRTIFKRGTSMASGGLTVHVPSTPTVGQGRVDGDRWHVPIKIFFYADVML